MRRSSFAVVLAAVAVLVAPAGSLAVNTGLPRIPIIMKPKAFKRTSTLQVSFTQPYGARSGLPEGYELFVFPPKGSKCKQAQRFEYAGEAGEPLTIRIAPKEVRPGVKGAQWCKGTYRVRLNFQGEDPDKPATGGEGPSPFVVDDYLIAARELKVK